MITTDELTATPPPVRTSSRPAADFDDYVLRYSRTQRNNVLIAATGAALVTGAIMYSTGTALVILVGFGIGQVIAGLATLLIAADAHARYTATMATSTITTYADPPRPHSVRPFIPSTNGAQTIRAGKFRLERAQWIKLFQTASDGGRLTRDGAVKALPRQYYRDWQSTIAELSRLGIVDAEGTITPDGWNWYAAELSPYPHDGKTPSGANSTPARRTHGRTDGGAGAS